MSVYGRLEECDEVVTLDKLRPEAVLRHRGDYHELNDRFSAAAKLVNQLGKPGLAKIAPFLTRYINDTRNLRVAWDHQAQHCGQSPGPDGLRYVDFSESDIWHFLRSILDDLKSNSYCPQLNDERVLHIPKGPGRGTRPLVIQNIEHRVVQRAVLQIVQPLVDPRFDDGSMGGRPHRGTWLALARAEHLSLSQGRRVWVTQDIQDAFTRVPLPRLMQILPKYLPNDELIELIGRILSNSQVDGLRQGGALSPFLLNLYLHHLLDRRWQQLHPDIPLIRYLDDILLLCRSVSEAKQAHDDLVELLQGSGMLLKGDRKSSVRALTDITPAEWLGYHIGKTRKYLRIGVGDRGWHRLADELTTNRIENGDDEQRAAKVIAGWIKYFAPCYSTRKMAVLSAKLLSVIAKSESAYAPTADDIQECWAEAFRNWREFRNKSSDESVQRNAKNPLLV